MTEIDPNIWTSLARSYMGGITLPAKGQEGYRVFVNAEGTNLAYYAPVDDLPAFAGGDAYKILQVNVTGTAVEWTDSPQLANVYLPNTGDVFIKDSGGTYRSVLTVTASNQCVVGNANIATLQEYAATEKQSIVGGNSIQQTATALQPRGGQTNGDATYPWPAGFFESITMSRDREIICEIATVIADDAALEISGVNGHGLLFFWTNASTAPAGVVLFRTTSTPTSAHYVIACGVANSSELNLFSTDTVLTGTTGIDTKLNISAGGTSLYVENRTGASKNFHYLLLRS